MTTRRVLLVGIAAILCSRWPTSSVSGQEPAVLGVEELMRHVEQHRGPIQVEGVVSAVAADHRALTLIDTRELRECGVTTCARRKLPVRWAGTTPRVGEVVRVEGEVQEQGGKRLFVARKLEAIPSPAGER